ncbi:MAG: hypothetical protein ACXACB_01255 [Promethearchaeota archaeon]
MYCPTMLGVNVIHFPPFGFAWYGPLVSMFPFGFVIVTVKPVRMSLSARGRGEIHILTVTC